LKTAFDASRSITFDAPIADLPQDRFMWGLGLKALTDDSFELYGRSEMRIWDGNLSGHFSAGIGMQF
jgi:hypothetical protein